MTGIEKYNEIVKIFSGTVQDLIKLQNENHK